MEQPLRLRSLDILSRPSSAAELPPVLRRFTPVAEDRFQAKLYESGSLSNALERMQAEGADSSLKDEALKSCYTMEPRPFVFEQTWTKLRAAGEGGYAEQLLLDLELATQGWRLWEASQRKGEFGRKLGDVNTPEEGNELEVSLLKKRTEGITHTLAVLESHRCRDAEGKMKGGAGEEALSEGYRRFANLQIEHLAMIEGGKLLLPHEMGIEENFPKMVAAAKKGKTVSVDGPFPTPLSRELEAAGLERPAAETETRSPRL